MNTDFPTVKKLGELAGVNYVTIQRDIQQFNKENQTKHGHGARDVVSNDALFSFLVEKRGIQRPNVKTEAFTPKKAKSPLSVKSGPQGVIFPPLEQPKDIKEPENGLKKEDWLQNLLQHPRLILFVLLSILLIDAVSIGTIGDRLFGEKIDYAFYLFGFVGFVCGIGAVVSYVRIQNRQTANIWKWTFAVFQFVAFEVAMGAGFGWDIVLPIMMSSVFISILKSVKA